MDNKIIEAIADHATQQFPKESCGAVVDIGGVFKYLPLKNVAKEPTNSFLLDPVEFHKIQPFTKYIVHSHPNRSPEPSDADKASCNRVGIPYFIIGVPTLDTYIHQPDNFILPLNDREFVYQLQDCLRYVSDYYQQKFNIDIGNVIRPPYGWWDSLEHINTTRDTLEKVGFEVLPHDDINQLKHGDVILLQFGGIVASHIAVYVGNGIMSHHHANSRGGEEPYGGYWKKNTQFFMRHKDLKDA